MKNRIEIVASGFGGQGVVRLGQIVGEAESSRACT